MWIEVKMSRLISPSLTMIASSKLYPRQGMKATSTLQPRASSPSEVAGPVGEDLPRLHPLALRARAASG